MNKRYRFEGNLPKVLMILQQPTIATLTSEELKLVQGIERFGKGTDFLTYKQMQSIGAIWKYTVNNNEYIHWDWWPGPTTHALISDE